MKSGIERRAKTMTRPTRLVALWIALLISLPLLAHANGKGKWVRKEVSGPAPAFRLTDQDGRKVSLQDFQGKVVLVSFIFTNCPAACPLVTAKMAMIHHELKGTDLRMISITIDPGHDTPAVLKEYGKQFRGVDFQSWSFLTGTEDEINDVLMDYKVSAQRRATRGPSGEVLSVSIVDHALKTFLVDRNGMKRFEYWGQDFDPKAVIKDLKTVLGSSAPLLDPRNLKP
jgi:protein SCO1/2